MNAATSMSSMPDRQQKAAHVIVLAGSHGPGGDVRRLPATRQQVQVRAGQVWISHAGQDMLLVKGEQITLPGGRDRALLSALGTGEAVVEVRQCRR
jgi:hypothetical protein